MLLFFPLNHLYFLVQLRDFPVFPLDGFLAEMDVVDLLRFQAFDDFLVVVILFFELRFEFSLELENDLIPRILAFHVLIVVLFNFLLVIFLFVLSCSVVLFQLLLQQLFLLVYLV